MLLRARVFCLVLFNQRTDQSVDSIEPAAVMCFVSVEDDMIGNQLRPAM